MHNSYNTRRYNPFLYLKRKDIVQRYGGILLLSHFLKSGAMTTETYFPFSGRCPLCNLIPADARVKTKSVI